MFTTSTGTRISRAAALRARIANEELKHAKNLVPNITRIKYQIKRCDDHYAETMLQLGWLDSHDLSASSSTTECKNTLIREAKLKEKFTAELALAEMKEKNAWNNILLLKEDLWIMEG